MTLPNFPAGVDWQALVLASLNLQLTPIIGEKTTPNANLNMALTPRIGMMPPALLNLVLSPTIGSGVGADTGLNLSLTPKIQWFPSTSLNLVVTPTIGAGGAGISTAVSSLSLTPSIGMTGQRQVSFDAAGTGAHGTTTPLSWSQTIGSSVNAALVMGSAAVVAGSITGITAKVGTTSMTQLGSTLLYLSSGGNNFYLYAFGLISPPTGAQTIAVTFTGTTAPLASADSLMYDNVSGFGTPVTNTGTGTALSISDSSAVGQRVACAMASSVGTTGTIGSFNQTSRFSQAGVSSGTRPTVIGDAPGAATVNFTATGSGSAGWGAMAVPVLP